MSRKFLFLGQFFEILCDLSTGVDGTVDGSLTTFPNRLMALSESKRITEKLYG